MLAHDVEIVDIDSAHWRNWFNLLMPPRLRLRSPWALLFLDHGTVHKAVLRGHGDCPPERIPFKGTSRRALRDLAAALDLRAVVVLDRAVIPTLFAEVESTLSIDDDLVAQSLVILRALKRHRGAGIWSEPDLLDLVPPVSHDALQRTFDLLIADNTSMAAYLFDGDPAERRAHIHASVIAVKKNGHIDLVTTHLGLADTLGEDTLARDWRRQYKRLLPLIGDRLARPSLAVFAETSAFRRVLTGPPDQLAREINERHVIIDPAPAWLLGLLGGATMAAFAGRGARALGRVLPPSARKMASKVASNMAHTAQNVMREHGADPLALLGFDPFELWHGLRHLYQPDP